MDKVEFQSKEEMLKNIKENYKKKRISYKQYMVDTKKVEKYYDDWKAEFEKITAENQQEQPNS